MAAATTTKKYVETSILVKDEKKHSVTYAESGDDPTKPAVLGTIYVPRLTLEKLGNPTKIGVRLTAED